MDTPVAIVGVSAAGKSTLAELLRQRGYAAHSLPQEHSSVRDLALELGYRHVVVLDAEIETVRSRRRVSYGPERLEVERQRLQAACGRAVIHLHTDGLTPLEVADRVEIALREKGVEPDRRNA
jgi:predicted kinase